jgi:hypothetical protein
MQRVVEYECQQPGLYKGRHVHITIHGQSVHTDEMVAKSLPKLAGYFIVQGVSEADVQVHTKYRRATPFGGKAHKYVCWMRYKDDLLSGIISLCPAAGHQ